MIGNIVTSESLIGKVKFLPLFRKKKKKIYDVKLGGILYTICALALISPSHFSDHSWK